MTSQTEQQIITIYMYIAQYLKKRQPEKSYTKCGEASPRPFYEKLYLCVSLNQRSEIL